MSRPAAPPFEIRDPIHGVVGVDAAELVVIDHPFVQRLRGIRQLGFSHIPFPGATHSRYAHSIGAMCLAGRAFDACFRGFSFSSEARRAELRAALRLAALTHDLGHPPFSHAAEFAMPPLSTLGIAAYRPEVLLARGAVRATHEDYTIAILTGSDLAGTIRGAFPFSPRHVAALISGEIELTDDFFIEGGVDLRPVLGQLVSSDLDVDRLDYLPRDSLYTGARYGQVDVDWLMSHLGVHVTEDGRACLALDRRAIYAFDDFTLSRFHMFVMVYFHQKSIAYERLLQRYMSDPDCDYRLPSDLDLYLDCDDSELTAHLRRSTNRWARLLAHSRPYRMVWEQHGLPEQIDASGVRARLEAAGFDVMEASAVGYACRPRKAGKPPIYVVDGRAGALEPVALLEEVAEIYRRYQDAVGISRLYVPDEDRDRALALLVGRQ